MPTNLWSFAVTLYGRPGVEAASLRLQDAGADVCLLLCAAWLGHQGVAWEVGRWQQLQALAQPWQADVVAPLRQLRQQWRGAARCDEGLAVLRGQLKTLELDAERQLLARLEEIAKHWPREAAGNAPEWLEQALPATARRQYDALDALRAALPSGSLGRRG
jgi:uncharacterized protein (TIGR02444 family)